MSHEYKFNGKVHPKRVGFGIDQPIPLRLEVGYFDIKEDVVAHFQNSDIKVDFESTKEYRGSDLITLKNYIKDAVQLVVDTYCYVNSYGYDVEVVSVECDDLKIDHVFFRKR
jgi:hypothetical protein